MADYVDLEKLVARIQQQLAPKSTVTHNVKLPGRRSETQRQIDILVHQKVGQYDIRIIIDCKDYSHPVDVKGVEEFYGLLDDVAAQKGVLVCPKGFTAAAKRRAADYSIDLYSPVDTGDHKWKANASIPTLCDFRGALISFGIRMSAPYPFKMSYTFYEENIAYAADGTELGTPAAVAIARWNKGQFPNDAGEHKGIAVFPTAEVLMNNGYGKRVPVTITADLLVERELYFGYFKLSEVSGFKDEQTDALITNAFTVHLLDPNEVLTKWQKLEQESDAPVEPALTLVALDAWAES